jgi:hypothetical protein
MVCSSPLLFGQPAPEESIIHRINFSNGPDKGKREIMEE